MKQRARKIFKSIPVTFINKTLSRKRLASAFHVTLFTILISGCGDGTDVSVCGEMACPAIARWGPYLSVVDQNGTSVNDAEITRTILRTNEVLPPIRFEDLTTSHHDNFLPQHPLGGYDMGVGIDFHKITTDPTGDRMSVAGLSQGRTFAVQFVIIRDTDPCACDPFKEISGPTQVVIQ